MAAFGLFGKIGMDISGFVKALAGVKSAVLPAADGIGKQIKQRIVGAITLGTSVAMIQKQIANAVSVRSGASKYGVSAEMFQAYERVAKRAGSSVEELVKALDDGGPVANSLRASVDDALAQLTDLGNTIDGDTVKRLADLSDKLDMLFGRLAPGLSMVVDWLASLYETNAKSGFMKRAGEIVEGVKETIAGTLQGDVFYGGRADTGAKLALGKLPEEVRDEPKKFTYDAVGRAADALSQIVRDAKEEKKDKKETARGDKAQVSQLVQVGGLLRPGMNSISVQQQMADRLRNIETLIRGAKD